MRLGIIGALLAFALGTGAGLLVFRTFGQPAPVIVHFSDATSDSSGIRVYVTGAVRNPGVFPLHAGDRVVNAVEVAGGPAADADTEAVNFAQRIQDEEHIHIPRVGDLDPASVSIGTPQAGLVDINRADANLLKTLPGLGPTRAAKIVESRQNEGPFQRPDDLLQRKLVTQSIYDQIQRLITTGS